MGGPEGIQLREIYDIEMLLTLHSHQQVTLCSVTLVSPHASPHTTWSLTQVQLLQNHPRPHYNQEGITDL